MSNEVKAKKGAKIVVKKEKLKASTRMRLAEAFKSPPKNIGDIQNPLIGDDKQSKRALAVALAIEVRGYADKHNLSDEDFINLLVESVAASGILYKKEGKYGDELKEPLKEAGNYAKYGNVQATGDNSYYDKYKVNVEACRNYSKKLTFQVVKEAKELVS